MRKNKFIKPAALLLAVACVLSFSACSKQSSSTEAVSNEATTTTSNQTTIYGKVTAIDGTKVTLALGTMNTRPAHSGAATSTAQPSGTPSAPPSGGDGTASQAPPSGNHEGQSALTLTGKTKTITISDTSILKKESIPTAGNWDKQSNSKSSTDTSKNSDTTRQAPTMTTTSAALSDVTVGTIVKVTYETSGEKLVSVIITNGMGRGQGQFGGPSENKPATDSTTTGSKSAN